MSSYHPWRALRGMAGWTFRVALLPAGVLGLTDHMTRTITLAPGQTQRQRRSTIAHEIVHAERAPFPVEHSRLEERIVDQLSARRLVPFAVLLDAAKWARNLQELAEECWVDEATIVVRLQHLHPAERAHLSAALADPL